MRSFFGIPTKLAVLAIIAGWLILSIPTVPASADERDPLMDLQRGGVHFFYEVAPSIVQIYNGGIRAGEMGSGGSGYVIDREGHCITNKHVADTAPVLEVAFYGDENHSREYRFGRWRAELVAEDSALDLAVIKVDAPADRFHPVRLGDSSLLQPGDAVATFGSPGGDAGWVDRSLTNWEESWLEFYNLNLGVLAEVLNFEEAFWTYFVFLTNPTEGWFSRIGPRDYGTAVQYLFHVDSAINHGNSGGPCLNAYGEAIGTNTWGFGGENVGFTVPVNLLKRSVADMLEYGRVRRPWCGIALHPTYTASGQLDYQWDIGAYEYPIGIWFDTEPEDMQIYTINPYSPAHEAGLREGDVIKRVDGNVFVNIFGVYSYFLNGELGQEVVIEYEREGHGMAPVVVTLVEKKTRYFGTRIDAYGGRGWVFDIVRYTSDITY